jgi:hypothetical protein
VIKSRRLSLIKTCYVIYIGTAVGRGKVYSLEPLSEMKVLAIGTRRVNGLPCIHMCLLLMVSTTKEAPFLVDDRLRMQCCCSTGVVCRNGSHRVVVVGGGSMGSHL